MAAKMTADEREAYVRVAEWIAQGIGPCDVGKLPGEINSTLTWLALDDDDPRKLELSPETLKDPATMQATSERLIWLVQSVLTLMLKDAVRDPDTWDVLRRIVDVAIARDLMLPTSLAELLAAIAMDLAENVERPQKTRGRPRGIHGVNDHSAQEKVALNVELVAHEMKCNGHRGGVYVKVPNEKRRKATACGIVRDALVAGGIEINYEQIVNAYRKVRKKL